MWSLLGNSFLLWGSWEASSSPIVLSEDDAVKRAPGGKSGTSEISDAGAKSGFFLTSLSRSIHLARSCHCWTSYNTSLGNFSLLKIVIVSQARFLVTIGEAPGNWVPREKSPRDGVPVFRPSCLSADPEGLYLVSLQASSTPHPLGH